MQCRRRSPPGERLLPLSKPLRRRRTHRQICSAEAGGLMTSQRRIDANRRNARRSTGPRTDDGKARSRLNAVKHGLSASLPALVDTPQARELAALLTQGTADPAAMTAAARLAVAEALLDRCRQVRASLAAPASVVGGTTNAEATVDLGEAVRAMAAIDRYERKARRLALAARRELEALAPES